MLTILGLDLVGNGLRDGNWRVVFRFEKGDALDVDLTDYH